MQKTWTMAIIALIIGGAIGFFGGMKYQASKTPAAAARTASAAGSFAGRRTAGGTGTSAGSFLNGQVLSASNGTITVQLTGGGSQVVVLAPSTQYREAVDGTASDVTVGSMVTVTGSTNSDGSLTAQSVQIRAATSTPQSTTAQ